VESNARGEKRVCDRRGKYDVYFDAKSILDLYGINRARSGLCSKGNEKGEFVTRTGFAVWEIKKENLRSEFL
jgi:hypothetical protein